MYSRLRTKQTVPKFMTISELSSYSGIPVGLIRKIVNDGEVDYFRPGKKTFYVNVESFMSLCSGGSLK